MKHTSICSLSDALMSCDITYRYAGKKETSQWSCYMRGDRKCVSWKFWSVLWLQLTFIYHNSTVYSRLKLLFSFPVPLDVKQGDDIFRAERAKRRHARPHELDSDDDDDEGKEDNALQNEETSDKADVIVPVHDGPQILVKRDFAWKIICVTLFSVFNRKLCNSILYIQYNI